MTFCSRVFRVSVLMSAIVVMIVTMTLLYRRGGQRPDVGFVSRGRGNVVLVKVEGSQQQERALVWPTLPSFAQCLFVSGLASLAIYGMMASRGMP